ncbi:hypothetical protein TWF718_003341 [Orbilia javanica]|uniref:Uncharacterized protein n=1 Tax=Orbilia javanica TaxID=47235 RepID=A0AAN8MLU6_9PEZI
MKPPKSHLRYLLVSILFIPPTTPQQTITQTITVPSNSTITSFGTLSCGNTLPFCTDAMSMLSFLSNTTLPSSTETSATEITSTSTLGGDVPTGTPQGFLVTASVDGGSGVYLLSYTGVGDNVGLVPSEWGNATYWFLNNGYLRDHNPPYRFLWLNPDIASATKRGLKEERDGDEAVVVYNLSRSYSYDEATENPLDSLRQVSVRYFVKNSVNTTVLLESGGVEYSFAARSQVGDDGVYDVIGVRTEDLGGLSEEYVPIALQAVVGALPSSSTSFTVTTSRGTATKTTKTGVSTSSISSIAGYAGTATDDGVMYLQTSPINLGTPAPVYLKPVSPFGGIVNTTSPDLLRPNSEAKMFYGAKGANGATILGNLNATLAYDSVYLDHSAFIGGVVCSGNDTMTVTWISSGREAWIVARDSWGTPLLLISADSSCPRFSNDTESFLLANSVAFSDSNGLMTVATGTFQELDQLLREFSLNVGPAMPSSLPYDYVPDIGTPNSGNTGLKFAAIGPDFNQRLNQEIGFFDTSTDSGVSAALGQLYPTSSTSTRMIFKGLSLRNRSVILGRGSFFSGLAQALADAALAILQAAVRAAISAFLKTFGDGVMNWSAFFTPDGIGRASLDQRNSVSCSSIIRKLGPWGCQVRLWMFLPSTVSTKYAQISDQISKWGNQLVGQTTYATPGIEVYCVDCYVDLQLDAQYTIRSNGSVITEAYSFVKGNMTLQLQIGLNAYWEYVWNGTTKLTTIGLGPINIGKAFQLGPYVDVKFKNDVKLALIGQILLGMSARWPSLDGRVDFVSPAKNATYMRGLTTPAITKIFQVYGSATITWTIGLPVSIAFGAKVDVGVFKWEEAVEFAFTPQIVVKVTFDEAAAVPTSSTVGGRAIMTRGPTDLDLFERQTTVNNNTEQYCLGALASAYSQIIIEFILGDIATLPLWTWPSMDNPFYLLPPTCFGVLKDVPMCKKSAVSSLKSDLGRETFCSSIYGWTVSSATTSTIVTSVVTSGSGVVTSTTTQTVGVVGSVTATSRVYTLTVHGYATSRTSAACTGSASVVSLASKRGDGGVMTRYGGWEARERLPEGVVPTVGGFGYRKYGDDVGEDDDDDGDSDSGDEEDEGVVQRAISTPAYLSGWNVTMISSACDCVLVVSPGTKVIYTTSTTPTSTSTVFSTLWITTTTTITTSNTTVATVTRTGATGIYSTLASPILTQSFPIAQYSLTTYTATAAAEPAYKIPFINYNLEIGGGDLASCNCGGSGGMTCYWNDTARAGTTTDFNITGSCAGLNDCSTMCTNINYLYGVTNLCVGTVFYPSPRNLCVFKQFISGLNLNTTAYTDLTDPSGCGIEKSVAGVRVTSGVIDYTTKDYVEWRYEYNYTQLARDYNGDPLTYHYSTESSDLDYVWYFDSGAVVGLNWNYTISL